MPSFAVTPEHAIFLASAIWVLTWLAAASWSANTQRRPGADREFLYRGLTIAGAALLFFVRRPSPHQHYGVLGWSLAVAAVAGFGFCWWARLHLGRMWSSSVTRKADHRIVDTGPYGLVRHPIYTGLIVACVALGLVESDWQGLLGATLVVAGCYVKARLEERFLREQLGPQAYDAYRGRVPMLIPWRFLAQPR